MSFLCSFPLAASLFAACGPPPPLAVGYVEDEFVRLAPIENAEVRSVRPLDGFTRLGLRFTDLGRESRQRLIQAIRRIERQLIRYARSGR